MIQHLSFTFFPFFAFATQLFSCPITSLNLRNQAPLFTELCLLQATQNLSYEDNVFTCCRLVILLAYI